ncbi:NUDIX domain-containing protein [Candidatus Parcubacteria bacterium]|nr:NUDIX domain-containing protein [Candidatus Parcubacteria bacterium]
MPFEKSAGAVIFRKEKDKIYYLLLHYPSGSRSQEDYWDFSKGHIEKGEKELETVKREAEEETGIKDLKFVNGFKEWIKYFFKFKKENIFKIVTFYLAETKIEKIKLSPEHIGFQWLLYEQATKRLKFDNTKEVLKKANDFIEKKRYSKSET